MSRTKTKTRSKKGRSRIEDLYELTPMQAGMLFHAMAEPGVPVYVEQISLRLRGNCNPADLETAWLKVVRRHAVLRTAFRVEGVRRPVQWVDRKPAAAWRNLDLRTAPDRETALRDQEAAELAAGFDLTKAPLWRMVLVQLDDEHSQLIWTFHHLILDGWSIPAVLGEWMAFMDEARGGPAFTPPQRAPFKQHIQWLARRDQQAATTYWRNCLAGFDTPTALPFEDGVRHDSGDLVEARLDLPTELSARLTQTARATATTVNTLLRTAWALTLGYHAGSRDVVLGATVAGRGPEQPGAAAMVGILINTVPVRVRWSPGETVAELLQRLNAADAEQRAFEHEPLVAIREGSDVDGDTPLFHSLFVFENYPLDSVAAEEGSAGRLPHIIDARLVERTSLPLTLIVSPGDQIVARLGGLSGRYDLPDLERILADWAALVAALCEPTRRLANCHPFSEKAWQALRHGACNGGPALSGDNVVALWENRARAYPERDALVGFDSVLNYGDLRAAVSAVAAELRTQGVRAGDVVALASGRDAATWVLIAAVLRLGAAYVPIDPAYPLARRRFMLDDCGARLLVLANDVADAWCLDADAADLGSNDVRVWSFDGSAKALAARTQLGHGRDDTPAPIFRDSAAYIIYTSGSTGTPKAVVCTHGMLADLMRWQADQGFTQGARTLQFAATSFDVHFQELFATWCEGGVLVCLDGEVKRDPYRLIRLLAEQRIERLFLPFVALQALAEAADHEPHHQLHLREIITAGEQLLATPALRRWLGTLGQTRLVNQYGPSETHVITAHALGADPQSWPDVPPIGRPVAGARVYVLDDLLRPVAPGVTGELYLAGPVARGYHRRPAETAARWLPDPFADVAGARMYRSGDLARFNAAGELVYVGRADGQVKFRGFRLELGELEARLGELTGVQEAVARIENQGDRRALVAYLAVEASRFAGVNAARSQLRDRLPEHMVPTDWVTLERLPQTPSGKLDRRALAASFNQQTRQLPTRPPRDGVESSLVDILANVLGITSVGVDDDFFALGGHSLLAAQVATRVRALFAVELQVKDVFEAPSAARLAERVRNQQTTETTGPRLQALHQREAPLAPAQQRLWFLDKVLPDGGVYNIPVAFRINGALDQPALTRALTRLAQRHHILRTAFHQRDDQAWQTVVDPSELPLAFEDLREIADEQREHALQTLVNHTAFAAFDLGQAGVWRAVVAHLAEDRYALILSLHHLIADGFSLAVLLSELAAFYRAEQQGDPAEAAELPLQYSDYALWLAARVREGNLQQQRDWWCAQLQGAPAALDLPTDFPRPARQSFRGATVSLKIDAGVTQALRELARKRNATLYMVGLAAFKVLLARAADQRDIVVGTPVAGRPDARLDGLIGMFANTLPLRTVIEGDPTFRELVDQVRGTALAAFAAGDVPFESLVDALAIERDPARHPLFQTAFVFQSMPEREFDWPGAELAPLPFDIEVAKFDMTLTLGEIGDELLATLEFCTDLFSESTANAWLQRFAELCRHAGKDAKLPISRLRLQPPAVAAQQVRAWQADLQQMPVGPALHRRFEAVVAQYPDSIALRWAGSSLTYTALNEAANRIAHQLIARGVSLGDRVGIAVGRDQHLVIAVLGVLKAGATYVPLDPEYPPARLAYLTADAGLRWVLGDPAINEAALQVLQDGPLWLDVTALAADPSMPTATPQGRDLDLVPAYVIYTSGSTGQPKGVPVAHRQVTRLFAACDRHFDFGAQDVWTLFHNYSFDFSVWEMWGALLYGGCLVMVDDHARKDPAVFRRLLLDEGVTVLSQTPSAFAQLAAHECDLTDWQPLSLKTVVFGGEALQPALLKPWFARYGQAVPAMINMYGITETTVHVTFRRLYEADLDQRSNIGKPLADLALFLLDQHMTPVAPGLVGELYVAGAGLAAGYLNRPGLTADRFVPHPWGKAGERLYRTGDLARQTVNGEFVYVGRCDAQVKIRGFRIELGEIEYALQGCDGVREAAVLTFAQDGVPALAGYVTAEPDHDLNPEALRAALSEKLPAHFVPAVILVMPQFPLTANGKLDRRALPAPQPNRAAASTHYAPPRDEVERILVTVLAETLGLDQVGIDDNFFNLGCDSIVSLRIQTRAHRQGVDFEVVDFFAHQNVRALAPHCRRTAPDQSRGADLAPFALVPEQDRARLPEDAVDAWPMSFMQQAMLFHGDVNRERHPYHNIYHLDISAPFDADALQQAVTQLADHHAVLRSTFHGEGLAQPHQVVHRTLRPALNLLDWRDQNGDDETRWQTWCADTLTQGFDLAGQVPLQLTVMRRDQQTWRLAISFHHAMLDGWSFGLLRDELLTRYQAALHGQTPSQLAPPPAFGAYVQAEQRLLADSEARDYWHRRLSDYEPVRLSAAAPAEPEPASTETLSVSAATSQALEQLAREEGVHPRTLLLAAHLRLLALFSGKADVATGLIVNTRLEVDGGDRMLGLLLNTLPFRFALPRGSWRALIRAVAAAEQADQTYRRYPYARLRAEMGAAAAFDVVFNYTNFAGARATDTAPASDAEPVVVRQGEALGDTGLPLLLSVWPGATLQLALSANGFDYGRADARRYLRFFNHLLDTIAADADADSFAPATAAQLWPTDERARVAALAQGKSQPAAPRRLLDLLAPQWQRHADLPAVRGPEGDLTYAQLEQRSGRIAAALSQRGLGRGEVIALALPRGVDACVALLAVVRAGAAYLPIDPNYPAERQAFMLADSAAALRITAGEDGPDSVTLADLETEGRDHNAPVDNSVGDDPTYLIYTSGSSGQPKGVLLQQNCLANLIAWQLTQSGDSAARTLQFAPLSFDVHFQEMWATWAAGGCLILVDDQQRRDADRLWAHILDQAVTRLCLPFVALAQLAARADGHDLSRCALQEVITAGEQLDITDDVRRLFERLPQARLVNQYGPSETHVVSALTLTGDARNWPAQPAIGTPIDNVDLWVRGAHDEPVPVGIGGRLWLGGVAPALGYHRRPELTAARFRVIDGARAYDSGDLARWDQQGQLQFLGRADAQVKVRGFRVETGEVEAALVALPSIEEAAVATMRDRAGTVVLAAWLVPAAGVTPSTADLHQALSSRLPDYAVPARFTLVDALPTTPSGKRDRRRLHQLRGTDTGNRYRAPSTSVAMRLAALWETLFERGPIGLDDHFFELGGHSLLAARLADMVRAAFNINLPLIELFENPTLEGLAQRIEAAPQPTASPLIPIREGGPQAPFFCVHPGGGTVLCYRELAHLLDGSHPFIGIQNLAYEGQAMPDSIQAMATGYIAAMRERQPTGPYYVGGWSMGGLIAFEIALQLEAAGERVALVALFDSLAPGYGEEAGVADSRLLQALVERRFSEAGQALDEAVLHKALDGPIEHALVAAHGVLTQAKLLPDNVDAALFAAGFRAYADELNLMTRYQPARRLHAPVHLMQAAEALPDHLQPDFPADYDRASNGWRAWSHQPPRVVVVSGGHNDLVMQPHVAVLARALAAALTAAVDTEGDASRRGIVGSPATDSADRDA